MKPIFKTFFMANHFVISVLASARTSVYACGAAGVDFLWLPHKNSFSKRVSCQESIAL
jgi:hypothetical protein